MINICTIVMLMYVIQRTFCNTHQGNRKQNLYHVLKTKVNKLHFLRYYWVVYGKAISNEFDRQSLSAMVDYWISPAAVKKEFEASRGIYI